MLEFFITSVSSQDLLPHRLFSYGLLYITLEIYCFKRTAHLTKATQRILWMFV